jgi:dienelactone hydrolase
MAPALHAFEQLIGDLREVRFTLDVDGEAVPGLAILPTDPPDSPLPLILIQHPATSSKDDYFVREVAMTWAKRGWICAGIDAPLHGERKVHNPMSIFRDRERFPEIVAQFGRELSATIDALAEHLPVDLSRLGYVGYSMGSMLGVGAVAGDGRFKAAAFCLVGEGGMVGDASDPESPVRRLGSVAVRIVGKTGDELIPRASTLALYDALPGEKDLVWLPGGHFQIGPDVVQAASDWLRRRL